MLEHLANTLVGLSGTLEVLVGTNLLADFLALIVESAFDSQGDSVRSLIRGRNYLFWSNWLLARLVKLFNGLLIVTEILLATNKDDGKTLAEVKNLRNPLNLRYSQRMWPSFCCKGPMRTFSWTLSRESGESTAKHIRMTWESGYERGRRRS